MQQHQVTVVMQRTACAAVAPRQRRQQAPGAPVRQQASSDRLAISLSAARSRRSSCWCVLAVVAVLQHLSLAQPRTPLTDIAAKWGF